MTLNLLKLAAFSAPLVLASCNQPDVAMAPPSPCDNFPGFSVKISADMTGGVLTTSVSPYTLVVPPPQGGGRKGDAANIMICLEGKDSEFSGQKIVWDATGPHAPPFDEFGVAMDNGQPRAGTKTIVLTNKNSVAAIYHYLALVRVTDPSTGNTLDVEIDPRVQNGGGGQTVLSLQDNR